MAHTTWYSGCLILLTIACVQPDPMKPDVDPDEITFELDKNAFNIVINDSIPSDFIHWQYHDSVIYYNSVNLGPYKLYRYDLRSLSFLPTLRLADQGPGRIGMDAIYKVQDDGAITVVSNGRIYFDYFNPDGPDKNKMVFDCEIHRPNSNTRQLFTTEYEENVYMLSNTFISNENPREYPLWRSMIILDKHTGRCQAKIKLPEEYKVGPLPINNFVGISFTRLQDTVWMSYAPSSYIYGYVLPSLKLVAKRYAGHSLVKKYKPIYVSKDEDNRYVGYTHHVMQGYYKEVVYDPYRDLFYRFVDYMDPKAPDIVPDGSEKELRKAVQYKRTGMVVLNQSMRKIGEIELEFADDSRYFITRDGLYIGQIRSLDNYNEISFHRYVIKPKVLL